MSEPDGLTSGRTSAEPESVGPATGDVSLTSWRNDPRVLYAVLVAILAAGSFVLRDNLIWESNYTAHTVMEAIATVLAFIVGALALVRYYSRTQMTFLLIGCGFLGAALLDMNHAIRTTPGYLDAIVRYHEFSRESVFSWSWTAERMFLSLFLFGSLLAWRQEVRGEAQEQLPEGSVYAMALFLTITNLLFFESEPGVILTNPNWIIPRPAEFLPAVLFGATFVGFLRKGNWRTDPFEHWMLVSLLLSALTHGFFMAFSNHAFDAMFDAAHVVKVLSYVAILTGLLSSVHDTFRREEEVLGALKTEIAERERTQAAVRESSERLQAFLDNANDLIQSVDRQGRFLYVNSAWKLVLGYSDADLESMTLFDIVHPAHRLRLERELERVLDGGEPRRFPVEYHAKDDRTVILSGSSQAVEQDGVSVATQSILRDVTEQRRAERRLAESQQKLEALVENTGDSIWSIDRNHRLLTLNSAFALAMEARTGREPKVGEIPTEVFAFEDIEWYLDLYDRTIMGERGVELRTDYVDGQLRYFEVYANPIQALDGVAGAVFFGKDVTQRVRAEEALHVAKEEAEAANKAKSDFLANMSHELRTPLNSVIGFTNILLKNKDERLNEKDIGFLTRVLSNGKHLLALINEVLDLAKVEAGRMELIIEEIDLAHLCVETVQQLEGQAKAKEGSIELIADVPDSVELVETDSAKLKQVIINLVGNALKFTHEGSVTVRLELAPDNKTPTAISVIDTGIGIAQDRVEAIFEAFQQAEAGTSRKYGGTGLGLALSRSICLLMGYDLIVESEEGKGSTFKIVMGERAERPVREEEPDEEEAAEAAPGEATAPVTEAPAEPTPDPAPEPEPTPVAETTDAAVVPGRARWSEFQVLVVDDEKDSRVLIEHYLDEFGCQVLTAKSGREAMEMAREHSPDLITLDLLMPDMSGFEVLAAMKGDEELRAIPIVVVSVLAGESRGKLLGAVDLVTKPFEREDLLRVLWRNLGRRRGGRVLVMVSDDDRRGHLEVLVADRGLEVVSEIREAPLEAIRRHQPDAAILDLELPSGPGVASLLELREDRLTTGLPLLVLTHVGLNPTELAIVDELATVHAGGADAASACTRLLDAVFPVAAVQEPVE